MKTATYTHICAVFFPILSKVFTIHTTTWSDNRVHKRVKQVTRSFPLAFNMPCGCQILHTNLTYVLDFFLTLSDSNNNRIFYFHFVLNILVTHILNEKAKEFT